MTAEYDRTSDRHKGKLLQVWLNDNDFEKINALASITGTRAKAVRAWLNGIDLSKRPDNSIFKDCLSELCRIGGLMKMNRIGTKEQVDTIFKEIANLRKAIYGEPIN